MEIAEDCGTDRVSVVLFSWISIKNSARSTVDQFRPGKGLRKTLSPIRLLLKQSRQSGRMVNSDVIDEDSFYDR
jgi:hypothetical protein